mmetsp:Transcript_7088/g.43842  ORF Transcript_7088/g.43842 Transcript_7088/m.43842 type:complete len:217 (-) Transcript_7088:348-998(-)
MSSVRLVVSTCIIATSTFFKRARTPSCDLATSCTAMVFVGASDGTCARALGRRPAVRAVSNHASLPSTGMDGTRPSVERVASIRVRRADGSAMRRRSGTMRRKDVRRHFPRRRSDLLLASETRRCSRACGWPWTRCWPKCAGCENGCASITRNPSTCCRNACIGSTTSSLPWCFRSRTRLHAIRTWNIGRWWSADASDPHGRPVDVPRPTSSSSAP